MRIVYIDDEQSWINTFRRKMIDAGNPAEATIGLSPQFSLEETYTAIMEGACAEAVVTDHELSDSCDVEFTGADLIKYLLERHPLLPCFVLTAFEDKAVKSDSIDVYHVYPKSDLDLESSGGEHSVSFYDRIVQQVEKTKRNLKKIEDEYTALLEAQSKPNWTSQMEDRLIELDGLLEQHHSGIKMSGALKRSEHSNQILELIEVTKKLLEEVKSHEAPSQN